MAMMDQDFWRRAEKGVPGMFDLGAGLYGMNAGQKEGQQRLNAAQDPLYRQASTASGAALTAAGNMDPRAAAAERFNAQSGLLAGKDSADEASLMRMLHAKGMLGAASFNPGVEGVNPTGTPMNPQMAAFYAARGGRDARMAADSLDFGDNQVDRMLKRSGMLGDQAANRQRSGIAAQGMIPSRTAANVNLLKGVGDVMKNTGVLKDVGGLFGKGYDWLTGGGFKTPWLDTAATGWGEDWYG